MFGAPHAGIYTGFIDLSLKTHVNSYDIIGITLKTHANHINFKEISLKTNANHHYII